MTYANESKAQQADSRAARRTALAAWDRAVRIYRLAGQSQGSEIAAMEAIRTGIVGITTPHETAHGIR